MATAIKEKPWEKIRGELWTFYSVRLKFKEVVLGGIPSNPEAYGDFVERKGAEEEDPRDVPLPEGEEDAAPTFSTFRRNKEGFLCLHGLQVRAMLKDAAARTGLSKKVRGLRSAFQQGGCQIKPVLISLDVKEPEGRKTFCGRVMGIRGERSVITAYDFVSAGKEVSFQIGAFAGDVLTEDVLLSLFLAGEEIGLGSARTMDFGKYELLEFEKAK